MMKVEWNTPDKKYHSALLEDQAAWLLKSSLDDEGYPVGIESMSRWECQEIKDFVRGEPFDARELTKGLVECGLLKEAAE